MRLADITVGEDYAIRWGGGPPVRGTVTYAGKDREYYVPGAGRDVGVYPRVGPRVFFTRYGETVDVPPGSVVCPWAEEQARLDAAAAVEDDRTARLDRLGSALAARVGRDRTTVRWDYRLSTRSHSTTHVVVPVDVLEAVLGLDR